MTTIYVIPNFAPNLVQYICDSQATIDARPTQVIESKDGTKRTQFIIPASQCSVGTITDADNMLASNQQAWLTLQADLFTVNLQTTVESGVVWTVVDLNAEPENTDREYFVLDPTTGQYTEAVGLVAAQSLLQQMHQNYLVFTNIATYQTLTAWPIPKQPKN